MKLKNAICNFNENETCYNYNMIKECVFVLKDYVDSLCVRDMLTYYNLDSNVINNIIYDVYRKGDIK